MTENELLHRKVECLISMASLMPMFILAQNNKESWNMCMKEYRTQLKQLADDMEKYKLTKEGKSQ